MRLQALHSTTAASTADASMDSGLLLCSATGLFLAFKVCITFLFFQANPQMGSAVTVEMALCLLVSAAFFRVIDGPRQGRSSPTRPMWWVAIYLGLSASSLIWTKAGSMTAAVSYWLGMAAEVSTIYLLLAYDPVERKVVRVMYGFIGGAALVAVVAWASPVMDDMRLGDAVFMHPNALGFEFAIATLFTLHLAREKPAWKWASWGFILTLVRTLSKGTIVGFLLAGLYYLISGLKISRRAVIYIGLSSGLVLISLWGILEAYLDIYAQGNNIETLTGRTYIWLQTLEVAVERPWLGYGFDSFRWVVPPLADFQPGHAHNDILQQFLAYGIVGVIVVCGLYWSFYRQAKATRNRPIKSLAIAILLLVLVRGLVDTDRFEPCFPLWLVITLSISLTGPPLPRYS